MRKLWAVSAKEVRQIVRDPLVLLTLIGIPTFMLLLFGYALNFDVKRIGLAVVDRSRTAQSRALVSAFVNSAHFELVAALEPDADFHRLAGARVARAFLDIPQEYADRLRRGDTAPVQLILDGADANTATTALNYASAIVAEENALRFARAAEEAGRPFRPPVKFEPRVWYNPELRSTQFLVPGLIGFILMLTAVISTALSIVREKERGTMEQLRLTPLAPGQLILGKTLPYLAISLIATTIVLAAARFLFGVAVRGTHSDLFLATLLYLTGAVGLGTLVSTVAHSQAMAFQVGALLSVLPSIFLSGFIFPIRAMPELLQALTYAFPARYYLVILRGIILKGAPLSAYAPQLLCIALYSAAVLSLAYVRLRRQERPA